MFGMNKTGNLREPGVIGGHEYKFVVQGTLLFLTGAPLSGKSTIAPLITSLIEDCTLQPMDIMRLVAQEIESHKPESERNPFVNYGSCDSYVVVGDGTYSPEKLVIGFNAYSEAVSSSLKSIIPKLEVQSAQNVLFEGVQLTPSLVTPYLKNNNRLVVITSDASQIESNRSKMFGDNAELIARYSTDKLLLLQDEIIRQSREIPEYKLMCVNNVGDYTSAAAQIIGYLFNTDVIDKKIVRMGKKTRP